MWKNFFYLSRKLTRFLLPNLSSLTLSHARLTDGKFASSPERMRQLKSRSHLKSYVDIEASAIQRENYDFLLFTRRAVEFSSCFA